jgi:hypothetical protein
MEMKALGDYAKQMQYNKTTAILIALQTYRIGGVAFFWGMTQGILDPAFAIPASVGDMLIGLTAIPFAIFLGRGYTWSKYAIIVWSVLGIADLVNAVTLGRITSPDFSNSAMATFPWILVPTVGVPLALALHGITLYRLRNWAPTQSLRKLAEL